MNEHWERVISASSVEQFVEAYLSYLESLAVKTGYISPSRKVIMDGLRETLKALEGLKQ